MPLKLKGSDSSLLSQETPCFDSEIGPSVGIAFHLPSSRRFIPYSWLLFSELNNDATELRLHYTHSIVTLTGSRLHRVQEAVERFELRLVREKPHSSSGENTWATVIRIEIAENAQA